MTEAEYDLCVVGGGINGAGIARDAAGRGLSVVLVEARDLASATSSASTKLIHGGLRYLEYFEFSLVRHSLLEREKLLHIAPHIIHPMKFILPHDDDQRPFWMLRLGLFLYDRLGGRQTVARSKAVEFAGNAYGAPLQHKYTKGFEYSDCWVDDARLVVLNVMDAREKGAEILTHTACTKIEADGQRWRMHLRDFRAGTERSIFAKKVVNASGPWVSGLLESSGLNAPDVPRIRLVKGSHIVIKKAFEGKHSYILQQPDKRIVFAIPYERDYTLIGTTEEEYEGAPIEAKISQDETEYLCAAFNRSFSKSITPDDVIWSYSGVRPLFDDGEDSATSATRDYVLHEHKDVAAPLISVFGGKLTTYRVLAQQAVDKLVGGRGHWTGAAPLPGGDIPRDDFPAFMQQKFDDYPFLPHALLNRYAHAYGSRLDVLLHGAQSVNDLGQDFGEGLYEAEVRYLIAHEFAVSAEDILWRRSKLGLHVSPETVQTLKGFLSSFKH